MSPGWSFWLQYYLDNCLAPLSLFIVRFINFFYFRFTVTNLKSVRSQFKNIIKNNERGLLICPNHLTYLDSLVIQFSLAPPWAYILKPSLFAWNLPKKANVEKSLFFRMMCYLGKCILLPKREDQSEIKMTMNKIRYLLKNNQCILLFPEGTRSNTGRVDAQNFSYGAGELLQTAPGTKVLCAYMRGDHQINKSKFPKHGEKFTISLKLIEPITTEKGLRGSRDLSRQIVKTLVEMEQEYFARK